MSALLRTASPALVAALAANAIRYTADLMTFTLIDGITTFNWTNFDTTLAYAGTSFTAQGPLLSRTSWKVTNTMEVPTLKVKASSLNAAFNGGVALQQQIHGGLLDGATFLLMRAYMGADVNPNTLGVIQLFAGKVGAIDLDGITASLTIKGKSNDLDQYCPRNLYQISCNHAFCDAGCTLNKASYTASYAVGTAPTTSFIPWGGAAPANYATYQNGTLVITSGAASGSRRTIAQATSAGLTLGYPLASLPTAGDGFTALQGCDKTLNSGSSQSCTAYGNTQYFRGYPFVPQPASSY